MDDQNQPKISELLRRLERIQQQQSHLTDEINELKRSIKTIEFNQQLSPSEQPTTEPKIILQKEDEYTNNEAIETPEVTTPIEPIPQKKSNFAIDPKVKTNKKRQSDFEKFIGENLINKIGIIILILGVAFGSKYSIEHNLISPLTRIIMGYITGIALLLVGMKLKEKYNSYSAVLVSGSMTIMYFITFVGYSIYDIIPQPIAFGMMLIFTCFTVFAAIQYNQQIIGILGLVGAYALPFLLSTGSGRFDILFGYMAIINVGIMVISIMRYWRKMFNAAFILTWLIFIIWRVFDFRYSKNFDLAFAFLTIFFIIFYVAILGYKLIKKTPFKRSDVILILLNSFIFYGIGYGFLSEYQSQHYSASFNGLGLFTLANALIHFMAAWLVFKNKLADRNLFYLIAGLVLTFVTMAIPVQLDGNWVTLLWALEATVLFWIGRRQQMPLYERLSYPLIALAVGSIFQDWGEMVLHSPTITTVFNVYFLSGIIASACFGSMVWLHQKEEFKAPTFRNNDIRNVLSVVIPAVFLITTFGIFFVEIAIYWERLMVSSMAEISSMTDDYTYTDFRKNPDLRHFQFIWLINYTAFFLMIISFVNIVKLKNQQFGLANILLNIVGLGIFLSLGLYSISELRQSYLHVATDALFEVTTFNLTFRYIALVFAIGLLFTTFYYARKSFLKINTIFLDVLFNVAILWILSSELLHWMDIANSSQMYKLGLSILWGVYAAVMVGFGIWKNKAYLRYAAILLFAITLVKLFMYDISHLSTISKAIVFVSLGVLLLIISFLYNKYKHLIIDDQKD